MNLEDTVYKISKTGPKLTKALAGIGIHTIADLLAYYPARYLDFSKFSPIAELKAGEIVTIRGKIKTIAARFSFATRKMLTEAIISDSTGTIKITWFNISYIAETLHQGDEVLLSGKVDQYKGLQLTNPIYEKVSKESIHTGRLVPVYKLPDAIFPKTFRKLVHEQLSHAHELIDILPENIIRKYNILPINKTVEELHFPSNLEQLAKAQERLAFEESFIQQLAVEQHRQQLKKWSAPSIKTEIPYIKSAIAKLPFTLTEGQKVALWTILQDIEHKHPMNRLLQGDVGSGKTIVALLAAMQVIDEGFQVAFLVPTEILARQHFENILQYNFKVKKSELKVGLLTRNFHTLNKHAFKKIELLNHVKNGKVNLLIGTHAILQESVNFKNLAFVIIDEQHRFGVEQRGALTEISNANSKNTIKKSTLVRYPHLLSMTATPIPRTAALALYGDLEITTVTELPKNRKTIKTWLVPEDKRSGAYNFIDKEIKSGRQAFIITPLVEESDKLASKAAKAEFARLQTKVFPHLKLGLVYGSMKGTEKDTVMLAFKNKEIDILVATSVIEIGIDIPNASVMIIEDAERFGLAQLHQLRGRVGRGEHQSYCLIFSGSAGAEERLKLFTKTSDGFLLAEYDLKTRGFGSLFGTNQTGFQFKYGQYLTLKVLEKAKQAAHDLTTQDPNLDSYKILKTLATPLSEELHME